MYRSLTVLAVSATLAATVSIRSVAQGFHLNEHGTCVMGRGGTGVASPCSDGSTILFNPAGIAGARGWTLSAGATLIAASGSFIDDLYQMEDRLQNSVIPVPHAYMAYGVNERLAVGFGVFVPYGLATKWHPTSMGRFLGFDNALRSIYLQPTAAYQVHPKIKVGAGLDYVVGNVRLSQRIDLSEFEAQPSVTFGMLGIPFHTEFADAGIRASGATGVGGNFGLAVAPVDRINIGVRYMTSVKLDYSGDVAFSQIRTGIVLPPRNPLSLAMGLDPALPLPLDAVIDNADLFEQGAPLGNQGVKTSITMPGQLVAGVALDIAPMLTFLFDWQWINWSVFDTLKVDFENESTVDRVMVENYRDTHGFRFGLDAKATEALSVRCGYLYHGAAAPPETVTPLLPDGDRNELMLGFGYSFGTRASIDLAYQHMKQHSRRGRVRDPHPGDGPTTELNSGLYSFFAHLLGATVAVHF